MLKKLSNYHLVYELLFDGKGEVDSDIEPIDTTEIISLLVDRSECNFGSNTEKWVEWFLTAEDAGSEEERKGIRTVKKIKEIENRSLKRIYDEE